MLSFQPKTAQLRNVYYVEDGRFYHAHLHRKDRTKQNGLDFNSKLYHYKLKFISDRFLTLDNILIYKNMDRTNVSITPIAGWMHFPGAEKSFWQIIVNCNQVQHLP